MSKKKTTKDPSLAEQAVLKQATKDAATANAMQGTVAGEIWGEIQNLDIEMFALPNQKVHMHCHPINIEPNKLYLLTNSSAVLPSLEVSVGKKFAVELVDKFVVVSKVTVPLTKR